MQFLIGIVANGIIVVMNSIRWIKQRRIDPLDLLISCLATSRIFLQLIVLLIHLVTFSLVAYVIIIENMVLFMYINELGLWLATWLSVFYCAKIATIPHPLFVWLKRKISKLVPWMIVGSLTYTFITVSIHSQYTVSRIRNLLESFFSKNATYFRIESSHFSFFFFIIELILPLLIFLIAVLLLIFSLGKHTQQMRAMATSTGDLCRSPHLRAMQSILSFLILYGTHYFMAFLFCFQSLQFGSLLFLFCLLVVGMYPAAHSVILILGNPKLKHSAKMFFLHGKCCW